MYQTKASSIFGISLAIITSTSLVVRAHAFDWKQRTNEVIQRYVGEQRNVGMVIGVIKDGKTWSQNYGEVQLGSGVKPDRSTIFEIGSVSKTFTSLALAQLVTQGKVKLSDRLATLIPELKDSPAGAITLVQLSTHTSGLPRLPDNLNSTDLLNPYKEYNEAALLQFLKSFKFPSPSRPFPVSYSNLGAGTLGYALSRVRGQSYEAMLRQLVLDPLKMSDTEVTLTPKQLQRAARGYRDTLEATPLWDFSVLAGAGGIRSTLTDMLTYLRANLLPDHSALSEAIKLSHQIQAKETNQSIGLAWLIDGIGDEQMIWHNGQTGGFHTLIAFKPSQQTGLIVLTNTGSPIQCLSSIAFGKDCNPPQEFQHPGSQLESFVGKYQSQLDSNVYVTITKPGKFIAAQITNQQAIRLTGLSEEKFDVSGIATVSFIKGNNGKITQLVLTQSGKNYPAKRVQ